MQPSGDIVTADHEYDGALKDHELADQLLYVDDLV